VTGAEEDLRAEFRALCRGWGVQRSGLRDAVGDAIRRWADVPNAASDADVRSRITRALGRIPDQELPEAHRMLVRVALALDPDCRFSTLRNRTETVATRLTVSPRTARRRIEDAFDRLAHAAITAVGPEDPDPHPDTGWVVESMGALVRLDCEHPEVIERRTIVATAATVHRISARFSLPREPGVLGEGRSVSAQVLYGARITEQNRDGMGHFRYVLDLPYPLRRGQEHQYTIVYRVLDGLPIRNYYAMVPHTACTIFDVRVRFALDRAPEVVWRIDRVHHRVLADPIEPGEPTLDPDGAGEVGASFADLRPAFGYGIGWIPSLS